MCAESPSVELTDWDTCEKMTLSQLFLVAALSCFYIIYVDQHQSSCEFNHFVWWTVPCPEGSSLFMANPILHWAVMLNTGVCA